MGQGVSEGFFPFTCDYPYLFKEKGKTKMKLNIYEKRRIVKTYEVDRYDLLWGTVEDVSEAVNLDSLKTGDNAEIIKLAGNFVLQSKDIVNNLLKDIFEGITDDEIRKASVKEIIDVFVEVVKYTIYELKGLASGSKN